MEPKLTDRLTTALWSSDNPFWSHCEAQLFWVPQKARLVGYLCPHSRVAGQVTAFFGYLASVNDQQISDALFTQFEAWAKQQGATLIVGPINLKTAYDYRLRLDNFEEPTFWGEPANPAYYVDLLTAQGFTVCQTFVTDFIDDLDKIRGLAEKKLPRLASTAEPWVFAPLGQVDVQKHKVELINLANHLFADHLAFQPLEPFDFSLLYNQEILSQACQKTSFLLFDQQQRLRGFCFSFPHRPHDPECLLIKTLGIDEEARHSGRTFASCLKYVFDHSLDYKKMAFCLMIENNPVHKLTKKYFVRRRTYGLFQKHLS